MSQKMIYNAGSMFTEAQWNTRKHEGEELRKLLPDLIIKNPVDFDTNQSKRPTNQAIFDLDYKELTEANYIIFEIDGWDSGTQMEYGLAVEQAKHNKDKYLFPVISDFRYKQGLLKGELPGFGLNEMITGSFHDQTLNAGDVPQLIVCESHQKAREAIKALETNDLKDYRQRFDSKELYRTTNMYHEE